MVSSSGQEYIHQLYVGVSTFTVVRLERENQAGAESKTSSQAAGVARRNRMKQTGDPTLGLNVKLGPRSRLRVCALERRVFLSRRRLVRSPKTTSEMLVITHPDWKQLDK